jgi:hypothetical protein
MRAQTLTLPRGGQEYRAEFGSLVEFIDRMATAKTSPAWKGECSSTRESSPISGTSDWYGGTKSLPEAVDLGRKGYTDADDKIQRLGSAIGERLSSLIERPKWVLDVTGDSLDVGLYLSHQPECWRSMSSEIVQGQGRRLFRLIVPTGAVSTVSAEAYMWAGATACAAVEAIERAGHGAEVWAYNAADTYARSTHRVSVRILIKAAEYPLDMPRLAFATAHPSFHRRLCFRFRETSPEPFAKAFYDGEYGHTDYSYLTDPVQGLTDLVLPTPKTCQDFIYGGGTQEQIERWLLAKLREAGIIPEASNSSSPFPPPPCPRK